MGLDLVERSTGMEAPIPRRLSLPVCRLLESVEGVAGVDKVEQRREALGL